MQKPPALTALMTRQDAERAKWRRGELSAQTEYPLEQEYSLELPLGYVPDRPAMLHRIAVLLHAFHLDLLPEIRAYLDHIPYAADLFISTSDANKARAVAACFSGYRQGVVETLIVPNRGRDVAPKLVGLGPVHARYDYVLHLHTKRSGHDSRLAGWRGYLLETLLGSPETVRGIFEVFARAPTVGLLAPQHIDELRPWVRWGTNFELAERLAARMGFPLVRRAPLDFPSGSMFWARTVALRPLLDLGLDFDDFPEESGQTDGTLAHAIERLYFLVCEQAGFDWIKISASGELHQQLGVTAVDRPQALSRFLSRRRLRLTALRDERRVVEDFPIFTILAPRPRRVLHVLWRRALGDEPARAGRLVVVPLVTETQQSDSIWVALLRLPFGVTGDVTEAPMQMSGESARRNHALRTGFSSGADLVLLLDAAGLMHPDCGSALMRMSQVAEGRAVLEVACFPQPAPKAVSCDNFAVPWADGPALAVPRAVFETTGGFDEELTSRYALMDFSWRARALGFSVRHCPAALYLTPPRAVDAPSMLLASGLSLASKWGDEIAAARFTELLREKGYAVPERPPPSIPSEWRAFADFRGEPPLTAVSTK